MKSVLVIGTGRFGRHLAKKMQELGNEVMIADENRAAIEELASSFPDSRIGDCTNEGVLRSLGVETFDLCFVAVGEDLQSSLVITYLLKKLGARHIVAKAKQDIQADLLRKIGADEVVYPERDIAEKIAVRYNANNIFDYIQLNENYAIYEIPIVPEWTGRTIAEVEVRQRYRVNIIAVKKGMTLNPAPGPDTLFAANDHVIVIGKSTDVFKMAAKT